MTLSPAINSDEEIESDVYRLEGLRAAFSAFAGGRWITISRGGYLIDRILIERGQCMPGAMVKAQVLGECWIHRQG